MPCMLATLLLALALGEADPHRQFDFWLGEWSVQNRHMDDEGTWSDGDVTRARITSVCAGRAVLEEWAGPFRGSFMNGFSLRSFDPVRRRWDLVLHWTTDGNAAFGTLEGAFRHGRGEFFAGSTRYSFSDALPNSVRWDSATSADGGVTWKTNWIMEFSRTGSAEQSDQDHLFSHDWTEGTLSPHPQARALDAMLGHWEGVQSDARGNERDARLRCKLLNKDCLVLDLLETRAPGSEDWEERLCVRGFMPRQGIWESWRVTAADPTLRRGRGKKEDAVWVFSSGSLQEILLLGEGDSLQIEELRVVDGESRLVSTTSLERSE